MVAVATQQTRARPVLMPPAMFVLSLMALSSLCVALDATGGPSRATATVAASVASEEKKGAVHQAAEHPRHRQAALASTKEVAGASIAARGIVRKAAEYPRHGEAALASTKEVVDASHATRDGAPIAGYIRIASTALAAAMRGHMQTNSLHNGQKPGAQVLESMDVIVEIGGATSRFHLLMSPGDVPQYGCPFTLRKAKESQAPFSEIDSFHDDFYHLCLEKPGSSPPPSAETSGDAPALHNGAAVAPPAAASGEDQVIFKRDQRGKSPEEGIDVEKTGPCSTATVTVCTVFDNEAEPEACDAPLTGLYACGDVLN